jgi:Domain of unknown function (DUF4375)
MTQSRFDLLFQGADADLFWAMITRIQDHSWHVSKLRQLPAEQATILRVCWFRVIFGNGGLQYWFECDSPDYGAATVLALRAVGLERSADALANAYQLFATSENWEDWERRMKTVEARRADIDACDATLWSEFNVLETAGGRFVRANREAFENLRDKLPYDPVAKVYGDAHE